MALPTRSYEIIGEHSAPGDFKEYIFQTIAQDKLPHITAKQVSLDKLAARRDDTNTQIEFDLCVTEIHPNDPSAFSGYMVTDGVQGSWILIEVTDCVQFDIHD